MNRTVALVGCILFVSWLFRRGGLQRKHFSPGLLLATIWLMILSSRPLSFWVGGGGESNLEGNPVDRVLYFVMIAAAFWILQRRGFQWHTFFSNNWALCLFYLYLLTTVAWADFPFVTFKRWFKEVGGLCLIMLIFSEKDDPIEALVIVFLRCAYVLLPLSVIFIKYIPELGRAYTSGGFPMSIGVTEQKNALGQIVLVFSLIIVWVLSRQESLKWSAIRKGSALWHVVVLLIGLWLLATSDSKTALLCLIIGTTIIWTPRLPIVKSHPKRVVFLFMIGAPLFLALDSMFNIKEPLLAMLGRDSSFTGRTEIWESIRVHPVNPLIGAGYLMYWDLVKEITVGDYIVAMNTAHNGYIEVYLYGGILGLAFLILLLLRVGVRTSKRFIARDTYGRLEFSFFIVALIYNFSESAFALRGPLWFAFLTICFRYPLEQYWFDRLNRPEDMPLGLDTQAASPA